MILSYILSRSLLFSLSLSLSRALTHTYTHTHTHTHPHTHIHTLYIYLYVSILYVNVIQYIDILIHILNIAWQIYRSSSRLPRSHVADNDFAKKTRLSLSLSLFLSLSTLPYLLIGHSFDALPRHPLRTENFRSIP